MFDRNISLAIFQKSFTFTFILKASSIRLCFTTFWRLSLILKLIFPKFIEFISVEIIVQFKRSATPSLIISLLKTVLQVLMFIGVNEFKSTEVIYFSFVSNDSAVSGTIILCFSTRCTSVRTVDFCTRSLLYVFDVKFKSFSTDSH